VRFALTSINASLQSSVSDSTQAVNALLMTRHTSATPIPARGMGLTPDCGYVAGVHLADAR
jgi:hypothetical protein